LLRGGRGGGEVGEGDGDEGDEAIDGIYVMAVVVGAFLGVYPGT